MCSILVRKIRAKFDELWFNETRDQSKLTFYASFKSRFIAEPYLTSISNIDHRIALTRFRFSAHKLCIETGRYSNKSYHLKKFDQACTFCMNSDNTVSGLSSEDTLPEPILEDEIHFLKQCPTYDHLRESLTNELSANLANEKFRCIFESSPLSKELAKFIFMATKYRIELINSRKISDKALNLAEPAPTATQPQ